MPLLFGLTADDTPRPFDPAPVADLVTSDLPQIKVNRCLIALVGKKAVTKVNDGVRLGPIAGCMTLPPPSPPSGS